MLSNRKYKDGVFTDLFSLRENLLELYHAITDFEYTKDTEVEIITLDGVLFTPLKNDLAALIEDRFVILMEHQSTLSENIPLRMFLYLAREYEKIIKEETLYKRKRVYIPTPELYVLYNGTEACPNEQILKLSDSFKVLKEKSMIELEVKQININYECNQAILKKSQTLHDYSLLIQMIRNFMNKGITRDEAIKSVLQSCIERGILEDYLKQKSSEVFNMLLTEYNQEDALRVHGEECKEEGLQEGLQKGLEEGLLKGRNEEKEQLAVSLLDVLDIKTISEKTGLSVDKIKELKEKGIS